RLAVDVGCGAGGMTQALAAAMTGGRVVGVDGEEQVLARAREHVDGTAAAAGIEFVALDFGTGVPALAATLGAPADLVWASASVHHVGDQQAAVDALAGLLAPGGRGPARRPRRPGLARAPRGPVPPHRPQRPPRPPPLTVCPARGDTRSRADQVSEESGRPQGASGFRSAKRWVRLNQLPELSRKIASMPYGRSVGSWRKTTPRAASSLCVARQSSVANTPAPSMPWATRDLIC